MTGLEVLIPLFAIFFIFGVPMIGLVTRFALQPLVKDVAVAIRGGREDWADAVVERLARLEERLDEQERQLERVVEAERFRRELEAGGSGVAKRLGGEG